MAENLRLADAAGPFDVTVLGDEAAASAILFSVGAGGNPERHMPLLQYLAQGGYRVIAPHFERMTQPEANAVELNVRANRLAAALSELAAGAVTIAGVGHSIGAAVLLGMAGGNMWLRNGAQAQVLQVLLSKLVLFAPAMDFFRAPGALDSVRVPVLAFGGSEDKITPPDQLDALRHMPEANSLNSIHILAHAGHFSFMDVPPPGTVEPVHNKAQFMQTLHDDVLKFVSSEIV